MKICSVIKWDKEYQNDVLVHKFEEEDFNTLTQLIVHENQEAIFYMNGKALDSFGPGKYTLETENIPFITKALNLAVTGRKNPFHCEVYFINKTEQMGIKWGTDSRIQYIEPKYNFPVEVGMSGELSLSIDNGRKLITKLVGTDKELDHSRFISYVKALINSKVKSYAAGYFKNNAVSIFEIDEHLDTLSLELKKNLIADFDDYGLELDKFAVANIAKPDGEKQYEEFKQKHINIAKASLDQQEAIIRANTKAQETIIQSKAEATKRAQEGYTYQQERGFNVADSIANNEAKGEFINTGVGIATAFAAGGVTGGIVGNAIKSAVNSSTNPNVVCPKCNATIPANSKFCPNCGTKLEQDNTILCPQCGKKTIIGKFCQECGAKLGD